MAYVSYLSTALLIFAMPSTRDTTDIQCWLNKLMYQMVLSTYCKSPTATVDPDQLSTKHDSERKGFKYWMCH